MTERNASTRWNYSFSIGFVVPIDEVESLALSLPEVTVGARYGNRTWFVGMKAFVWERPFSMADIKRFGNETPPGGPILAVAAADLAEKEALLAAYPDALFSIAHFDGFPAVLVQLDEITPAGLREVVIDGWLACAPSALTQAFVEAESGQSTD